MSAVPGRLSRSQLQAALDALVAANRRAFAAREKVVGHCEAVYGVAPGDVDNDTFIDKCDSGCGIASGMSVDEFDLSMRDCMEKAGMEMPEPPAVAPRRK